MKNTARDADLLARPRRMFDHNGPQALPHSLSGCEQPRRAGPKNNDICLIHPCRIALTENLGKHPIFRLEALAWLG